MDNQSQIAKFRSYKQEKFLKYDKCLLALSISWGRYEKRLRTHFFINVKESIQFMILNKFLTLKGIKPQIREQMSGPEIS